MPAIEAASDLEENTSKINVVFGEAGKAVTELSGEETGASSGDQRANELQKQGISLQTFKAKRGNFS